VEGVGSSGIEIAMGLAPSDSSHCESYANRSGPDCKCAYCIHLPVPYDELKSEGGKNAVKRAK
jgi:hypothetical protein